MKTFKTEEEARNYLNNVAKKKNIQHYHIWAGDKDGDDVMILTKEDGNGAPVNNIDVVVVQL